MSIVTSIAIRSTQILTLAFLLVALAGGARLARAGEIETDCDDTIAWADETVELWEDLEPLFADVEDAVDDEDPEAVEDAADDLADAADEQAELDVPRDVEDLNDELVEAYEDAADAAADLAEAVDDEDEDAIDEGLDALAEAQEALADAVESAEELAEECEDGPNGGGEAETVELEVLAVALDAESEEPIEDAMFIILQEGVAFEDFDLRAFFGEGDEDQVLAVGRSDEDGEVSVEAEIEVDGEYTVILVHEDYEYLKFWNGIVFAADEDAEEFDFGVLTLTHDVETN
jgi:hypothetical protein